ARTLVELRCGFPRAVPRHVFHRNRPPRTAAGRGRSDRAEAAVPIEQALERDGIISSRRKLTGDDVLRPAAFRRAGHDLAGFSIESRRGGTLAIALHVV